MSFRDWPDANDGSSAGSTSRGVTAANSTSNATSVGGATAYSASGGSTFDAMSAAGATAHDIGHGGTATGGTATGGTATAGTATGGTATGGTATGGTATGGTATGGTATAGTATAGTATAGTASSIVGEEIKWLSLQGTRANATDPPNAGLGIDGQLRIDSDGCADVSFEPTTRCVSGSLCAYSYAAQTWGVALVFDFVNTDGLRYRWDPRPYDAQGVAFRIGGSQIPRLQLWVLDMDTETWPNACSSSPCEIVGPPYGDDRIGTQGVLYFDSMMHDNWDGSGVDYRHQPENTLSLQFKIPAVIVGGIAFDFCLDQLGIIVEST